MPFEDSVRSTAGRSVVDLGVEARVEGFGVDGVGEGGRFAAEAVGGSGGFAFPAVQG